MSDRLELANRLDFIAEVSDGGREPDHSSVTRRSAKALRDADCAIETLQAELADARAKVGRARADALEEAADCAQTMIEDGIRNGTRIATAICSLAKG